MKSPEHWTFHRRQFLRVTGGLIAGTLGAVFTRADDRPENTHPQAIAGDAVEPDWRERPTITVGPGKADLVGATDRVIQAGVEYIVRLGGGTVRLLPGTYRLLLDRAAAPEPGH